MMNATKVTDDIFMVPWDQGNGVIRREVWVGKDGRAVRYHLAYINQDMSADDNGRVLGFEYADGHLREFSLGKGTVVPFTSLEELEERFDVRWNFLPRPHDPPTGHGEVGALPADEAEYGETKGMKLAITKGSAEDFFRHGKKLAALLDRGEPVEPERVVMFGSRMDLCYTQMPKGEWASLRGKLASGEPKALE